jgi:signal transduction histidine kinase
MKALSLRWKEMNGIDMDALARRDALRIFRLVLIVQLVLMALSFWAVIGILGSARMGPLMRALPTLVLALLFLPPWLEGVLGRYHLAVGLGLDVLFSSLEAVYFFGERSLSMLASLGLPPEIIQYLEVLPPIEPFFFLLIPLVLLAWGYGRRGALLGSTWAAGLYLSIGVLIATPVTGLAAFLFQALSRIVLLYLVPLIVSVLAERERTQLSQLELAHQRLRRHATTVEQLAISRERNRMARDLHDTLAHSLSALIVQLEALRALLANDPVRAEEMVDDLSVLARRGLEESRQAIQALRRDPVEVLGLEGALRDMLQSLQIRSGIQATLSVAGEAQDLTAEENRTLYLVAEEALTNVERHASAGNVIARLGFGLDRVDLVIEDDGTGFDPHTVGVDRYGLTGMVERANMIGATLEVDSQPGKGTRVWCLLPR